MAAGRSVARTVGLVAVGWLASAAPVRAARSELAKDVEAYLRAPAAAEGPLLDALSTASCRSLAEAIEAVPPLSPLRTVKRHDLTFESRGATWTYSLRLPSGYQPNRRYPVLALPDHASVDARDGLDFWASDPAFDGVILFRPVITRHQDDRTRFPDPQFFAVHQAMAEVMRDGLAHLRLQYAVDPDRVTMTGLSQAGFLTWFYAVTFPDDLAAIVPESAGGTAVVGGCLPLVENVAGLTVRILHAKGDKVCPYADALAMHDAALAAGARATLVTYDDADWKTVVPPSRHPGPHDLRRRHVADVVKTARRTVPTSFRRRLRYAVQGIEGRFRVPPPAKVADAFTVTCAANDGRLTADRPGVVYLASVGDVVLPKTYRLSNGLEATTEGVPLRIGTRSVFPTEDPRLLLRTLKRTGDRGRLVAAEVPLDP